MLYGNPIVYVPTITLNRWAEVEMEWEATVKITNFEPYGVLHKFPEGGLTPCEASLALLANVQHSSGIPTM